MLTGLQFPHILLDGGASDTGVALGAHVVAKSNHHLTGLLGQLPKTNIKWKIMEARIGYGTNLLNRTGVTFCLRQLGRFERCVRVNVILK